MKLARDYYMESYSTEDYSSTQMSAVRIMYMIAELSRRIGDIENATRFSRVIENKVSVVRQNYRYGERTVGHYS